MMWMNSLRATARIRLRDAAMCTLRWPLSYTGIVPLYGRPGLVPPHDGQHRVDDRVVLLAADVVEEHRRHERAHEQAHERSDRADGFLRCPADTEVRVDPRDELLEATDHGQRDVVTEVAAERVVVRAGHHEHADDRPRAPLAVGLAARFQELAEGLSKGLGSDAVHSCGCPCGDVVARLRPA